MKNSTQEQLYWTRNLQYLVVLMYVWFMVSYGLGILLADPLNEIHMGGFKLGFWFAQQGSIYVFVVLIFIYVILMNRLDNAYRAQSIRPSSWRIKTKFLWVVLILLGIAVALGRKWVAEGAANGNYWPLVMLLVVCHLIVLLFMLRFNKPLDQNETATTK